MQEALEAVNYALEHHPKDNRFIFVKGYLLKATNEKKEGNKLLRSLEINPQVNTFASLIDNYST